MIYHDEHTRFHISIIPNADQIGNKKNTGGTDGSILLYRVCRFTSKDANSKSAAGSEGKGGKNGSDQAEKSNRIKEGHKKQTNKRRAQQKRKPK